MSLFILHVYRGPGDHTLRFMDIYVGWPGSVHDARVLRNSPLYQAADNLFQGDTHLLGDSAYPLQRCIISLNSSVKVLCALCLLIKV